MTRILFICLGNICRSPMAEYVMKDLTSKAGLSEQFEIASAATSAWEIGNPVYPPARQKLAEHGIDCNGKTARQMTRLDYARYDHLIGMAAYDALSMVPAYASSKAAVDMFTKWLSNYLSNTAGKVRVNAVAPGYFLTPLNHDMYVNPDGSYTQRYWNVIHRTPMGRLGDPKELVGALRFFADPEMSGYITGQVIAVDGGFLSCPGI